MELEDYEKKFYPDTIFYHGWQTDRYIYILRTLYNKGYIFDSKEGYDVFLNERVFCKINENHYDYFIKENGVDTFIGGIIDNDRLLEDGTLVLDRIIKKII